MKRLVFYGNPNRPGATKCRALDIAENLEMPCDLPLNEITSDDVIIMIKRFDKDLISKANHTYVDFMDGHDGLEQRIKLNSIGLKNKITILTFDSWGASILKKYVFKDFEVKHIPHTHCNNENRIRPFDREIKNITYNGNPAGFPNSLWIKFEKLAIKEGFNISRRHTISENVDDVRKLCCNFYYNTDIAVSFRNGGNYIRRWHPEIPHISLKDKYGSMIDLKCATKLNNAASFGIPYIAYPEHCFLCNYDRKGTFIPVTSIEQMVNECVELRTNLNKYKEMSKKLIEESKPYHIDSVSKLYLDFLKEH